MIDEKWIAEIIKILKAGCDDCRRTCDEPCWKLEHVGMDAADLIESLQYLLTATIAGQETLQRALAASQVREKAAVEDLSTYKDCGFCIHLQDQQYCYKNCQRHVDVDNFRTHPCWQWRGPEEGEPHETV